MVRQVRLALFLGASARPSYFQSLERVEGRGTTQIQHILEGLSTGNFLFNTYVFRFRLLRKAASEINHNISPRLVSEPKSMPYGQEDVTNETNTTLSLMMKFKIRSRSTDWSCEPDSFSWRNNSGKP